MARLSTRANILSGAIAFALFQSSAAGALDNSNAGAKVVVTPLASTTVTASGQPIVLPQKNVQVLVSSFEIPPGATLPVHKHPSARYAYVLEGQLQVTNVATGQSTSYKKGDFIVEMIGAWHQGSPGIRAQMWVPSQSSSW